MDWRPQEDPLAVHCFSVCRLSEQPLALHQVTLHHSSVAAVTASIVLGSGLGLAAYLITAADLSPLRAGNDIIKFADNTYLIVPATNSSTCCNEHQLETELSKELVFFWARSIHGYHTASTTCQSIDRIEKLTVLGVIINEYMTAIDHVRCVLSCYHVLQARSQGGGSDRSDDPPPPKCGQVRFLRSTFLSVSEWFH